MKEFYILFHESSLSWRISMLTVVYILLHVISLIYLFYVYLPNYNKLK